MPFGFWNWTCSRSTGVLKEHPTNSFVILDDEDHDWATYGYDRHWVRPSWFGEALTENDVQKALDILKIRNV